MPRRQHLERIESRPKEVVRLPNFAQTVELTVSQKRFYAQIVLAIQDGKDLPEGAYRTTGGRDTLLLAEGVMHLHLGHAKSNELLYLVQYPDHVVLIEIGDHNALTDNPVGRGLLQKYRGQILMTQEIRKRRAFLAKVNQDKADQDKEMDIEAAARSGS